MSSVFSVVIGEAGLLPAGIADSLYPPQEVIISLMQNYSLDEASIEKLQGFLSDFCIRMARWEKSFVAPKRRHIQVLSEFGFSVFGRTTLRENPKQILTLNLKDRGRLVEIAANEYAFQGDIGLLHQLFVMLKCCGSGVLEGMKFSPEAWRVVDQILKILEINPPFVADQSAEQQVAVLQERKKLLNEKAESLMARNVVDLREVPCFVECIESALSEEALPQAVEQGVQLLSLIEHCLLDREVGQALSHARITGAPLLEEVAEKNRFLRFQERVTGASNAIWARRFPLLRLRVIRAVCAKAASAKTPKPPKPPKPPQAAGAAASASSGAGAEAKPLKPLTPGDV